MGTALKGGELRGGGGGAGSGVTKRVGEGRVERLFRVHELARRSL